MQMYYSGDESASNTVSYERSRMQKDMILQMLKKRGCRITKQRMMILDIILEEDCSCCKEIYYKASKLDPKIGTATVYRMINTLEEIGAISRKNRYHVGKIVKKMIIHLQLSLMTIQLLTYLPRSGTR